MGSRIDFSREVRWLSFGPERCELEFKSWQPLSRMSRGCSLKTRVSSDRSGRRESLDKGDRDSVQSRRVAGILAAKSQTLSLALVFQLVAVERRTLEHSAIGAHNSFTFQPSASRGFHLKRCCSRPSTNVPAASTTSMRIANRGKRPRDQVAPLGRS